MSTVGDIQYRGGTQITNDDIPLGTEHPHSAQKIPPQYSLMCLILFSSARIHSESRAYLCMSKFQGLPSPPATKGNLTEIYARADRDLNRAAHLT